MALIFHIGYSLLAGLARERNDLKSALEYYNLAYGEDPDAKRYYQVCTVADQFYQDPKVKLDFYERFMDRYGKSDSYFLTVVSKRILELKKEIHFPRE